MNLDREGRDVVHTVLTDAPTEDPPLIKLNESTWHAMIEADVDDIAWWETRYGQLGDNQKLWLMNVHGVFCDEEKPQSVELTLSGQLVEISQDGVVRHAGRIHLT